MWARIISAVSGLGDAFFFKKPGGPAQECQDGPGDSGGVAHLGLQGLGGGVVGGKAVEKFIQVAVRMDSRG